MDFTMPKDLCAGYHYFLGIHFLLVTLKCMYVIVYFSLKHFVLCIYLYILMYTICPNHIFILIHTFILIPYFTLMLTINFISVFIFIREFISFTFKYITYLYEAFLIYSFQISFIFTFLCKSEFLLRGRNMSAFWPVIGKNSTPIRNKYLKLPSCTCERWHVFLCIYRICRSY